MQETSTTPLTIETKPTKRISKKKGLIIAICLLLIAAGGYAFYTANNHPNQDWRKNTAKVVRGSIDVRIIATGTIKPVNEVKVSPKSTGLITKLLVKQGDIVKQGQILAYMDGRNIEGQIESARGTYLMAQDNALKLQNGNRPQEKAIADYQEKRAQDIVRQAERNVVRLRAQVDSAVEQQKRDDKLLERQAYLETQGGISAQDLLNAETTAKMTRSVLTAARQELAQAEATLAQNKSELQAARQQNELSRIGNRSEDIQSAKDAVLQAKGNLDYLISQKEDMVIRAPFAGVITQKYADSGAIVTPTTSAATTSATSSSIVALAGDLEMVAEVAETDIGKIKLGQPVEIVSNSFPERPFHGTVTQIAPEAVVTQNVTTFEVHTSIDDDLDGQLLSGMNVSARFVAGTLDDVCLVPAVSIVSRKGRTGVLLAEADGKPKFKRVKIGPTVDTQTAVLHGLDEGDLVFIGLNKDQLEQQGYGDGKGGHGDHGGGGGGGRGGGGSGGGAPIPRSFGH